jgi:hypothetical protein
MLLILATKRKRRNWDRLQCAVEALRKKEMEFLKTLKILKVPRLTLKNYVNHMTKIADPLKMSLIMKRVLPQDAD